MYKLELRRNMEKMLKVAQEKGFSTQKLALLDSLYYLVRYNEYHGVDEAGVRIVTQGAKKVTRSFKKWAERMVASHKHEYHGFVTATEADIEALSTLWGELFKPASYTFEVVSDDDLIEAYRVGPKSCMSGEGNEALIQFYPANGVKLLKISNNGEYMGRALIWPTLEGTFMDRVYPSDGGRHARAAREYAHAQGWMVRENDSAGLAGAIQPDGTRVEKLTALLLKVDQTTPYIDTFRYAYVLADSEQVYLSPQRPDNARWVGEANWLAERLPWYQTDRFGTSGPAWEMRDTTAGRIHHSNLDRLVRFEDGRLVHPDDLGYCALTGRRLLFTEAMGIAHNGYRIMVHPDVFMPQSEVTSRGNNSHQVLRSTAVLITTGFAAGLYGHPNDVETVNGQVWDRDEYHDYYHAWRNDYAGQHYQYAIFQMDSRHGSGPWFRSSRGEAEGVEVAPGVFYDEARRWYYMDRNRPVEETYHAAARHHVSLYTQAEQAQDQAAD